MSGFLLDTNVLSESSRRFPDPRVVNWLTDTPDEELFTSVLALAEIRLGIELLDAGKRRAELELWFRSKLLPSFRNRILPVSRPVADRWAVLSAALQRAGKPKGTIDGLLAATAVEHDLAVVTRDADDLDGCGVRVVNPWD